MRLSIHPASPIRGSTPLLRSVQLGPKDDVNEKCGGRAVVTCQIREQDVDNVVVDRHMVHKYYTDYYHRRLQTESDLKHNRPWEAGFPREDLKPRL